MAKQTTSNEGHWVQFRENAQLIPKQAFRRVTPWPFNGSQGTRTQTCLLECRSWLSRQEDHADAREIAILNSSQTAIQEFLKAAKSITIQIFSLAYQAPLVLCVVLFHSLTFSFATQAIDSDILCFYWTNICILRLRSTWILHLK